MNDIDAAMARFVEFGVGITGQHCVDFKAPRLNMNEAMRALARSAETGRQHRGEEVRARKMIRELRSLGYRVELPSPASTA